jgi:CheY-like chemotaxis protein
MPNLDGFGATQRIRKLKNGGHPRIVALTADVLKGEREKCLEMGMSDYASKPIKIEVVKTMIANVHAWLDGAV